LPRYDYNVPEPTAAYVASRRQQFAGDPNYYGVETSLRLLFNSWPRNSKIDEVLAKASCLDRLYSTNVYAIVPMAEQIVSLEIDTALDVGDPDIVERIATLKLETSERRHYSFATKYCSFSRPDRYHIFDGQVNWLLQQYRKRFKFAKFDQDALFDYRSFAAVLSEFVKVFGLTELSKKELDKFLWIEAGEIWRTAKLRGSE